MIGTWGNAKQDVATITDASSQYIRDTDLGKPTDFTKDTYRIGRSPAKGSVATIDSVTVGSGYSLTENGLPKEGILCSATGGSGTGAQFIVQSVAAKGLMITGSSVKNTANFDNFQNSLRLAFDPTNPDPYTYARTFATGLAFSGVSIALAGTSATGTVGTFIVTINNGSVTKVTVVSPGALYKVGDVVTITEATLQAVGSFGGPLCFVKGDLTLLLTEENVTGSINTAVNTITVVNGGSGYTIGDTLTLQEVGSSNIGDVTLGIGTLSISNVLSTSPNSAYPTGILNTGTEAGTIAVMDVLGNTNILGSMLPGVPRKFTFQQVLSTGSTIERGFITILY